MTTITPEQFEARLRGISQQLSKKFPGIALAAGNEMAKLIKDRIQKRGQDAEGGKILNGKYDKKPIYVNPDKLPTAISGQRGGGKTKSGKGIKKDTGLQAIRTRQQKRESELLDGTPKKTIYFGGGYAELRESAGRRTDFVDLTMTGASVGSIKAVLKDKKVVVAITETKADKIFEKHETRTTRPIVTPSKDEAKAIKEYISKRLLEVLKNNA